MGLKSDIYAAFEKNLGKDFVDSTTDGKAKVNQLAEDLSKAVRDYIKAQTFTITKLEASTQQVKTAPSVTLVGPPQPPGAPSVPSPIPALIIPNLTVKMNSDGASDNLKDKIESQKSAVRLMKEVEA